MFFIPVGVTHTYDPTTRRLVFTIPDNLVNIGDPSNDSSTCSIDYNQLSMHVLMK
jgi:hypothetical protein